MTAGEGKRRNDRRKGVKVERKVIGDGCANAAQHGRRNGAVISTARHDTNARSMVEPGLGNWREGVADIETARKIMKNQSSEINDHQFEKFKNNHYVIDYVVTSATAMQRCKTVFSRQLVWEISAGRSGTRVQCFNTCTRVS